jgi:multidrug efflux pump subunit AcrA (membrane-fusion protein)
MPVRARGIGAAALALALFTLLAGCGKGPPQLPPPEAPTVAVANPGVRPYAPYKEFTGRLATKDPVKVVPRVSGIILRRLFADGAMVVGPVTALGFELRPGQPLFEIDPVLYDADVKKADADQKKAAADIKTWTAQIDLTEAELKRVMDQVSKGVGIPADKDKAVANLDVAKAQKEAAIASKAAADATQRKAQEKQRYTTV